MLRHEFVEAATLLPSALSIQTQMGSVLEAARTQLLLAETSAAGELPGPVPRKKEAIKMLVQARERFLAVGAQWDLSEAKRIVTAREATGRAKGDRFGSVGR